MNIQGAISTALRAGWFKGQFVFIRLRTWDEEYYWRFYRKTLNPSCLIRVEGGTPTEFPYGPSADDLQSTDWIVPDEDPLVVSEDDAES